MKTGTVLLIGAGAYALYYFSQVAQAANTINIVFQGIDIKSPTNYVVTMRVQNVTNVAVPVNSMTGQLSLDSNQIGDLSYFGNDIVPANGEIDIPVNVSISLFGLPAVIKDLVDNGGSNLNFNVTGNANVGGLVLPFNFDKTMSV